MDWLIGLCGAAIMRLAVYLRGKDAKKYRKNVEYGSARWGNKADIAPFMDPKPENNIILTQSEGLMLNGRPKIRPMQEIKCTGSRRIRFGKNALFHQAQSDANAQFLRRHRSERYSPCGMRKDVAARHTKAGQGRKAYA